MTREDRVRRVQELRRSNATTPRPSSRIYRRKPKHRDRPTRDAPRMGATDESKGGDFTYG